MLTCLGKYLRTFRIERGELLKDMAEKLSLAPAYLSSIENGKRVATKKLIDNFIKIYQLSENEVKDLMDAFHMSLNEVSFSMSDANNMQKSVGIAFARKFGNLNEEQIKTIKNILDEVDC